ncbi:hypothetical protein HKBW3S43_00983, partial [Candidatus Hakubella thermalkaliphila]
AMPFKNGSRYAKVYFQDRDEKKTKCLEQYF